MARTWFITGTSRGFGREWASAALQRGDEELWNTVSRARPSSDSGNPVASAAAVLRIVDAEQPPLRCFLGPRPLSVIEADSAARLETWRTWQPVAELAQG